MNDLEQIRFTQQHRQVFHRFDVQIDRTHLRALLHFARPDTDHFDFLQQNIVGNEHDVHLSDTSLVEETAFEVGAGSR